MLGLHCCPGFSLVAARGAALYGGAWASRCGGLRWGAQALEGAGFSGCGSWALSRAQAQSLWFRSLVALWHVGSSRTRNRTRVSCIGRWILYHWATGEAQKFCFFKWNLSWLWEETKYINSSWKAGKDNTMVKIGYRLWNGKYVSGTRMEYLFFFLKCLFLMI